MNVDLWLASAYHQTEDAADILSESEFVRAGKYRFEKDRNKYIARRTILRTLLGKYLNKKPSSLVIAYGKFGKPFVKNDLGMTIHFNVSHSNDLVVFAFSFESAIGVDLEYIDHEVESELITKHFFAKEEIKVILHTEESNRSRTFYKYWTVKEAFIKAIGKGLTFPLDHIITSNIHDTPELSFAPEAKMPGSWNARIMEHRDDYIIALAADRNDLTVRKRMYGVD